MGIFRRSPSPAVPAQTAAAGSPSLDASSSSNSNATEHTQHHHLHAERAYASNPSSAMPSPNLQPPSLHTFDHSQIHTGSSSSKRSRSRSPLLNVNATYHNNGGGANAQRARSPALLTPSLRDDTSGHAYPSRSPSPQPATSSTSSPWAGYPQEGQFTSINEGSSSSASASKPRSRKDLKSKSNNNDHSNNKGTAQSVVDVPNGARQTQHNTSVEIRRLELLEDSRKSKAIDLARFSVNGMLNLVEQRMMMDDQQQHQQQSQEQNKTYVSNKYSSRAHGLGLSVSVGRHNVAVGTQRSAAQTRYSPPSSRQMHTVGEEAEEAESEEILSSISRTSPTSKAYHQYQQVTMQGRPRTSSAASDATQLRDEVVDLLQLARNASSSSSAAGIAASTSTSTSTSSSSHTAATFSSRNVSMDNQSYTSRSSESSNAPMHASQNAKARYVAGTASREDLEELARSISPFPVPSTSSSLNNTPTKTKKKFGGLFGGGGGAGKKSDVNKEESNKMRSQSPLPPSEERRAAQDFAGGDRQTAAIVGRPLQPPVAGAHRGPVSAQHRRKRSMSVGDAVPFAILQSARQAPSKSSNHQQNSKNGINGRGGIQQQQQHRLTRPDVYDESYFSSSKMPYYHQSSSLNDNQKKRSKQLGRLGISEDDLEVDVQARQYEEEESLQGAKERLLAHSRTVAGHPSASSSGNSTITMKAKREGPHVGKVNEAQYATYHQEVKNDELPSASASLSSMTSSSSNASASSKDTATKRRGQLVVQHDTTGQLHLPSSPAGQPQVNVTSWTTPSQSTSNKPDIKTRINRSNSDASVIDPFLPRAGRGENPTAVPTASNVTRPAQLAVPAYSSTSNLKQPTPTQGDSVWAIGPPPASPLPSPPRTAASLPNSRVPSPSLQIALAPSPAPTSPLPPMPAALCPPPTKHRYGLPQPPTRAPPAAPLPSPPASSPAEKGDKSTEYDFELRPHRTKQQGRAKVSPLQEPALDRGAALGLALPRPFGTKGIVQRPPSALDMTLLPSPAARAISVHADPMAPASVSVPAQVQVQPTSASSSASLSGSMSSGSLPTPKAREFNKDQIRRRQETSTTVASQYSVEGDYETYDASRSSASSSGVSSSSSSAMVERVHSSGSASASSSSTSISNSSAGHTALSSATTSYSTSSMSSYVTRPSLSMDGHSTSSCSDDYSSVSTHDQGGLDSYRDLRDISPYDHHRHQERKHKQAYTYTHVNDAVPMKPPKNMSKMTPSPSCESVNNLAGIGLAGASSNVVFPHSRRLHFGWSRHKAMMDLSSHAEDQEDQNEYVEHVKIIHGGKDGHATSSPGSEEDTYANILSDYAKTLKLAKDDEGYVGSSPEMVSPPTSSTKVLARSHGDNSARQKITHERPPVKQARSFDQLKAYR